MSRSRHAQLGINLVELMIVICILAMSLAVGIPGFQDLKTSQDRSAALVELVAAVRLARSEAALRGIPFSVCATTDGLSCSGGRNWSGGWLVFRDADRDTTIEDATQVVKAVRFAHSRFTLTADAIIGGGITFGTFGFSTPTAGAFTYQDTFEGRDIALTYIGKLHVTEAAEVVEEPAS
jgi:type IV fimbrial biogenesis protein FimT